MQLERTAGWLRRASGCWAPDIDAIDRAEDRELFKEAMREMGQPVVPSGIATDGEARWPWRAEIGYPVIVRPAFTLGGTGGGIAEDERSCASSPNGPGHALAHHPDTGGKVHLRLEGDRV
jgi:carbamoylphosphate synthase large subunit